MLLTVLSVLSLPSFYPLYNTVFCTPCNLLFRPYDASRFTLVAELCQRHFPGMPFDAAGLHLHWEQLTQSYLSGVLRPGYLFPTHETSLPSVSLPHDPGNSVFPCALPTCGTSFASGMEREQHYIHYPTHGESSRDAIFQRYQAEGLLAIPHYAWSEERGDRFREVSVPHATFWTFPTVEAGRSQVVATRQNEIHDAEGVWTFRPTSWGDAQDGDLTADQTDGIVAARRALLGSRRGSESRPFGSRAQPGVCVRCCVPSLTRYCLLCRPCAVCKKAVPTMLLCGSCDLAAYGSAECQAAHWLTGHKARCGRSRRKQLFAGDGDAVRVNSS